MYKFFNFKRGMLEWRHVLSKTLHLGKLEVTCKFGHSLRVELDRGGFFPDTLLYIGEDGGDVIDDRTFVIRFGDGTPWHLNIEFARGAEAMNTFSVMWNALNWINIHWGDERGVWSWGRFRGRPINHTDEPIDEFPF